jgi:flagellar protein FliS
MFGSPSNGASAYSRIGVETGVVAATPNQLVVMLFTGAILAVSSASRHMAAGEVEAKGKAISKAVAIISEGLRASLNKNAGGEIAQNLDSLYEYMTARLVQANLKNDSGMLTEVHDLLNGLKDAWESMDASAQPAPQEMEIPKPPQARVGGYDALAPQATRLIKA